MTKTMELNDREVEAVRNMRAAEKAKADYMRNTLELLKTAHEFERWTQKHGRPSAYSAFREGFDCEPLGGGGGPGFYHRVMKIIGCAKEEATK